MGMTNVEKGDRVRDKFKLPRPGDEAVHGVVEKVSPAFVFIRMDDGKERMVPRGTFVALFERVEG